MKIYLIIGWNRIQKYSIPLCISGGFLLLGGILLYNISQRKNISYKPLIISPSYICDNTHILPCIKSSPKNNTSNNTYTLMDDMIVFSPQEHARSLLIRQLIAQGFTGFITTPYLLSGNNALVAPSITSGYSVTKEITGTDMLDTYVTNILSGNIASQEPQIFTITKNQRQSRTGIYLFKNTSDLLNMGYRVVSHRSRKNTDKAYRRYNIAKSFELFHHVQILLPGDEFTFLDAAQYDDREQKNYKKGYVIKEGEEIREYGGGICGASTAVYQGILTNKSIKLLDRRPHTKRFSGLYPAYINGQYIATPGIDSAIYAGLIDLRFRNESNHPIILVANYDGSYKGYEQVFTLGYSYDQGSFEFLRGGYIRHDEPAKEGTGTESIRGGCYTRSINGTEQRSCYKEIH